MSIFPNIHPQIPHDKLELQEILNLLNKIPSYVSKLEELTKKINDFSRLAYQNNHLTIKFQIYEIEKMIFRAFLVELENKPFKNIDNELITSLKASLTHEDVTPRAGDSHLFST